MRQEIYIEQILMADHIAGSTIDLGQNKILEK